LLFLPCILCGIDRLIHHFIYDHEPGFIFQATDNFTSLLSGTRIDLYATPTGGTGAASQKAAALAALSANGLSNFKL